MPKDPRFPDRPDHPDFERLSKVGLAHDARTETAADPQAALLASLAEIANPACVDYMAEHRVNHVLQKMGVAVSARMELILRATWVDAFRLGFAYARQLDKEAADDAKEF